jgi:RNA polymerase sigma factor (sigma-70 family)
MSIEREIVGLLPRIRRFAHSLSRSAADADDLTQMTMERALKSQAQWRPGTRLDRWLYRIARNLWIDLTRQRARQDRLHAVAAEEPPAFDPTLGIEASLDAQTFMRLMDRLPPSQREVLALVLVEGLGYRDCADLLNLPLGTVASRLTRGRVALLAMVEEFTSARSETHLLSRMTANDAQGMVA